MLSEKHLINKIYKDVINQIIKEVRYIDPTFSKYNGVVHKTDIEDVHQQDPIKSNENIRVYHGCDIQRALDWAKHGFSGMKEQERPTQPEKGVNPIGIFVTVDFEHAQYFARNGCIIEFTANSNDLDTPVWNGSDYCNISFLSNTTPFNSKEERDNQKQHYQNISKNYQDELRNGKTLSNSHIRNSDNPALARMIFTDIEAQALFLGSLSPNQIKRIWVKQDNKNFVPYKVRDFIRKYGNIVHQKENDAVYLANEDFNGFDDFFDRIDIPKDYRNITMQDIETYDYMKLTACQYMYPKQIIQAFGKEFFTQNFIPKIVQ